MCFEKTQDLIQKLSSLNLELKERDTFISARGWRTRRKHTWVRQPKPRCLSGGRQLQGDDAETQKGRDDPHTGHWDQHLRGKTEMEKSLLLPPRSFQASLRGVTEARE